MELIKYSVGECVFYVPESMTDGVWKQAFEANNQTIPNQDDICELNDKEYKEKLRKQQDNNEVYLSPSWSVEQVSELITGDKPFNIAREFAEEDLKNVGLAGIGGYEVEIKRLEASIEKKGIDEKDLRKWLKQANRDFLDTLLISLGASQDMINISFLSKKRSEVFKLIRENNSNRAIAQIKYFINKVEEGKKLIKDAESEVEQAYEEYYQHYRDAKDTLKEAKDNLKSDISDVVKYTSYELDEQKQETYENHTKAIERDREKKKREKARFQKLLAFSEGVALASIDGIAPQYIQAAQEIGNQVMIASNHIIAGHQTQDVEAGSEEQTKLVVKGTTKIAKDLIKQKASDRELSIKKLVAASNTSEINVNNRNTSNNEVAQAVGAKDN